MWGYGVGAGLWGRCGAQCGVMGCLWGQNVGLWGQNVGLWGQNEGLWGYRVVMGLRMGLKYWVMGSGCRVFGFLWDSLWGYAVVLGLSVGLWGENVLL